MMWRTGCIIYILLLSFAQVKSDPIKILFLGNGLISFNNIPHVFEQLSASAGYELEVDMVAKDSYALSFHNGLLGDSTALNKINEETWNFVVLQEQSYIPVIQKMRNSFTIPAIEQLTTTIKNKNRCARIFLMMTWAKPFGGEHCVSIDSIGNYCTSDYLDFFQMQNSLESVYFQVADQTATEIAPVGTAWKNALLKRTDSSLFWSNSNLANESGAYLSACVLFTSIFQQTPVGLEYISTVGSEMALFLQTIAERTVLSNRKNWRIKLVEELPSPDFDYEIHHNEVRFIDKSSRGIFYYWNLGDGNISRIQEPSHTYERFTTYEVCLKLSGEDKCPQIFCRDVVLEEMVQVFPNPFEDELFLKFSDHVKGDIYLTMSVPDGRKIWSRHLLNPAGKTILLETESISQRIYLLNFTNEGKGLTRKVIKE